MTLMLLEVLERNVWISEIGKYPFRVLLLTNGRIASFDFDRFQVFSNTLFDVRYVLLGPKIWVRSHILLRLETLLRPRILLRAMFL